MSFLFPSMLLALLALPLLVGLYLWVQRQRQERAAAYRLLTAQPASPARAPARRSRAWLRHVPPILFLLGLVVLLVSLARPTAQVQLPTVEGTVVLVFDVSASMAAADVEPSRMEAAKTAAREFILRQPATVQIAIVSFSSGGFTVQSPTNNPNELLATIDRLEPASGTSLGQGILAALQTIAVDAGLMSNEAAIGVPTPEAGGPPPVDAGQEQAGPQDAFLLESLPEGDYPSSTIVLLTDGEDNQSVDPLLAAQAAAERSVRVDALGFGTPQGFVLELDGYSVHTALNEPLLQQITQVGGGTYFPAAGQQDPESVYASLRPQLVIKPEMMEITALFLGASLLLFLMGSVLSMLWFHQML